MNQALIERGGAHALAADEDRPEAEFQHGVTETDVAMLLVALEAGTVTPFRSKYGAWHAGVGNWTGMRITQVVSEAIRTGLVIHLRATQHVPDVLVPALVHLPAPGVSPWRTACSVAGEGMGPKRVRIHQEPAYVDCLRCLDLL